MESRIRISHYEKNTTVLGPGHRFVIWFQGCKKRCPGCINPEGRSLDGGYEIDLEEMLEIIRSVNNIQGVTISGGEPFLQFSVLKELIYSIKKYTKLDVMLFSGYKYSDILEKYEKDEIQDFFLNVDIFVDGEYVEELNDNQIFRGSENQNIYYFTPRYRDFSEQILNTKNRNIEFSLDKKANIFMVGIPPKGFYDDFISNIKKEI